MNTISEYDRLCRELHRINRQMQELQAGCPHSSVKKEPVDVGGGGEPWSSGPYYVTHCTCNRCGKTWTIDGAL